MAPQRAVEVAFLARMNRLMTVILVGFALFIVPGPLLIYVLRPIDEYMWPAVGVSWIGFIMVAVAAFARVTAKCPQCGKLFCGAFNDPDSPGSKSIFTRSCMQCGYKPTANAI